MEQKARLIKVLTDNGVSRTGNNWQKATAIVEWVDGQFTKTLAMSTMNKAEALANLQVGVEYNWHFDVASREYNGRWFTEATVWRWDSVGVEQGAQPMQGVQPQAAQPQYQQPSQLPPPPFGPAGTAQQPMYGVAGTAQQRFNVPQQEPDMPF